MKISILANCSIAGPAKGPRIRRAHLYSIVYSCFCSLSNLAKRGGGGTALPQFHRPCIEIPQLSASPIQLLTPPDEDSYCRPYPISATYLVMAATSLQLLRSEITTKFCSSSGNLLKALLIVSKLFFFGDGITKTSLHCSAYLLLKSYLMCLHELKLQLFKENLKRTREKCIFS